MNAIDGLKSWQDLILWISGGSERLPTMEQRYEQGCCSFNDRPFVNGYIRRMERAIAVGSDHAGFELKKQVVERLTQLGWVCQDFGTHSRESMDYPDIAHPVADAVALGQARFGVLICGSGVGVSIAANRHPKVRCALAWIPGVAKLGRNHNDANILALPARFVTADQAMVILDAFLQSDFEAGRHQRRVEKIEAY
ncbi:MAG: ribose 5-phosphate isomerase B [Flavobacteriales bacterium]